MNNDIIKRIEELEEALTSRFNKYEAEQENFSDLCEKILNVSKLIFKIACVLPLDGRYMHCITNSGIELLELKSISVEDNELVYHFYCGVSTKHAFPKRVDAENYIKKLYGIQNKKI